MVKVNDNVRTCGTITSVASQGRLYASIPETGRREIVRAILPVNHIFRKKDLFLIKKFIDFEIKKAT